MLFFVKSLDLALLKDELSYLKFEESTNGFPKHYHDTFVFSHIIEGTEELKIDESPIYNELGSLLILNPLEVHSCSKTRKNSKLTFESLYISQELVDYYFKTKGVYFNQRKIDDPTTYIAFLRLKNFLYGNKQLHYNSFLEEFFQALKFNVAYGKRKVEENQPYAIKESIDFVDHNIKSKFSIDKLSRIANINKYSFIRNFKKETGLTPFNYILMKKVFASQQDLKFNESLTDIAFQYNFNDIAHYSNTFKKFVGFSPSEFQKLSITK